MGTADTSSNCAEKTDNSVDDKKPNSSTQQEDDSTLEFNEEWMLRTCETYEDEHYECKCLQQRFQQYFIYGGFKDCSQWKTDLDNCLLWRKYGSKTAYKALVESEKKRRIERLKGHYANDIWEKRKEPPSDWNAPLPKWMEEKLQKSYLAYKNTEQSKSDSSCTIL